MSEKVLFVDDDPMVLDGIRRQLGRKVNLETATSGQEGLRLLDTAGPFAVVVSDMRMPAMQGSHFLGKVREGNPDTVRIILSGQSDLKAAIDAVNFGQIFRFMTKPCEPELLWSVVESALRHYRLIHAERDLVENTLGGAIKMLVDLLGLTSPVICNKAARIQRYVQALSESVGLGGSWELRLAAMLSHIGCITLPPDLVAKVNGDEPLTDDERRLYDDHPAIGGQLLARIARLESVAAIVASQTRQPDLDNAPRSASKWGERPLAELVLWIANALDQAVARGATPSVALHNLISNWSQLPAAIGDALRMTSFSAGTIEILDVYLADLTLGMVLDEDLKSVNGIRLAMQGQEVTQPLLIRLRDIAAGVGIKEPIKVRIQRGGSAFADAS